MIAVRDEQTALVSKLLELRADPTVKSLARTDSRQEHFAWVGSSVYSLARAGTATARLLSEQ